MRNCQGDSLRLALRRYRLRKGPRKLHCVRSQPRCSDFRCRRPSDRAQRPVAEPDHHLDAGGGPTSRATLSGRSELSSHSSNYAQAKQCCDEFLTHHSLIGGCGVDLEPRDSGRWPTALHPDRARADIPRTPARRRSQALSGKWNCHLRQRRPRRSTARVRLRQPAMSGNLSRIRAGCVNQ